jgi:hypothetical protein
MSMRSEQRKKTRKAMRHNVWLHVAKDRPPVSTTMSDISETGARLDVGESADLPERFLLLLSKNGQPRRLCRVVWRSGKQVGVQFETPTAASSRRFGI